MVRVLAMVCVLGPRDGTCPRHAVCPTHHAIVFKNTKSTALIPLINNGIVLAFKNVEWTIEIQA